MISVETPSDFKGKRKIIAEVLIAGGEEEEARVKAKTTIAYVRKVKSQMKKLGIPQRGSKGHDPDYSSPGQLAAKLFNSFMKGKSVAEAVVKHQLPYLIVRQHHSDYLNSKNVSENEISELIDFYPRNKKLERTFEDIGGDKMTTCKYLIEFAEGNSSTDPYCMMWKEKNPFVWEKSGMKYRTLPDGWSIIQPTVVLCALCPFYQKRQEE